MSLPSEAVEDLKIFENFYKKICSELSDTLGISYRSESSEKACLKTYEKMQSRKSQINIDTGILKECSSQSGKAYLDSDRVIQNFPSCSSSQKLDKKLKRTPTFGTSEVTQAVNIFKEETKIMQKLSHSGESPEKCHSLIDISDNININLKSKTKNTWNKQNYLENEFTVMRKSHSALKKSPKEISEVTMAIKNGVASKRRANLEFESKEIKMRRTDSNDSGQSMKHVLKDVGNSTSRCHTIHKNITIPGSLKHKSIWLSESNDCINEQKVKPKPTNQIVLPNSSALYTFMCNLSPESNAKTSFPALKSSKSSNFSEFCDEINKKTNVINNYSHRSSTHILHSTFVDSIKNSKFGFKLGTKSSNIDLKLTKDDSSAVQVSCSVNSSKDPYLTAKPLEWTSESYLAKILNNSESKFVQKMSEEATFNYEETQTQQSTNTEINLSQENAVFISQPGQRKTYNISSNSILHEDRTLRMLISEKENLKLDSDFNRKAELAVNCSRRCYIKRYKKGNLKIFKLKRRVKNVRSKIETPEEKWSKFFKTDHMNRSTDLDSVSTPISYETDETKSEAYSTGSNKLPEPEAKLRIGINRISKNKTLVFSKQNDSVPYCRSKEEIMAAICNILKDVLEQFEHSGDAYLKFPSNIAENFIFKDGRYQLKPNPQQRFMFFTRSRSQAKFNLTLIIMKKIKALLESNMKLTKRELYYQLKTLVFDQRATDRILCELSRMLGIGIWAMNITAQKGLVFGNLNLVMSSGEIVNCNAAGALIPSDVNDIVEIQSTAYFILIVEKESIYQKLLEEDLPNKLTRPFILVTGKGYPDFGTQLFIKKLWMVISIPVFILVDADPDGISIMLNYRFGSLASAHISDHLVVPKAKWIGVFPSEITLLGIQTEPLSEREVNKLKKMVSLECIEHNPEIKRELEVMLEMRRKASIEGLIKNDTYLSNCYLSRIFYSNKFK